MTRKEKASLTEDFYMFAVRFSELSFPLGLARVWASL